MKEFQAVKDNDLAGGLITNEQADNLFELSSLQLIVHAFGMVGGKKLAETATNSAMWEKPDVHAGLAAHQTKICPFSDDLRRMNFTNVEACLEHLQASHLTNFIRLAAGTKSLPNEVRDVYDKVADKIRSHSVKDLSINTLDKAAKYCLELQSVFESKKINPVVKKMFDPAFKKRYQEENDLRVLHGCNDTRGEDVRGGRRARGGAERERGRGPSNDRGRGREKSADRAKSPDRGEVMCFNCDSTEHRAGDLKCPKMAPKSCAAFKSVLILQRATKVGIKCATICVNFISCAMRRKRTSASWALNPMRPTWRKVLASTRVTGGTTTRSRGLLLGQ